MLNLRLFKTKGAKRTAQDSESVRKIQGHAANDGHGPLLDTAPDAQTDATSAQASTSDNQTLQGDWSMEKENSALDDFIYLVSHDLRASMRALLEVPVWIAEDLHEAGIALPEPVKDHMTLLDRHTSRLDRMLFDLLAYSRVGRMQNLIDVKVPDVIEQVLDEVPLPDGWEVHQDIGHGQLEFGDKDIFTLFSALISNAVKHGHPEGGSIWIATSKLDDDFVLTVSDNGPGIAEEHRTKVFEIMRTLRPRDQVEGSGMGLALVDKLAKIYGGTATANPAQNGTGTSIRFVVPAARDTNGLAA